MSNYSHINDMAPNVRRRTVAGLKRLRQQLDAEMPRKTRTRTLVLGTWNIRNFDDNRFMNAKRTLEDLYYIAEIIARFDVIAVQEICDDLGPLDRVMDLLGRDFAYIVTDITEGSGGNKERLGFVFDRNKVRFKGVAGELVLPDKMQIIAGEKKRQFSRTPFMCSFQSGWFKFLFSTVHIYFGKDSGAKYRRRVDEIETVAAFLARRAAKDRHNHILVGDFNIKKPGSPGANVLAESGFKVFQNKEGSNKNQTRFYDQISFLVKENQLQFAGSERDRGVLQFFDSLYREADFAAYRADLKAAVEAKIMKIAADVEDRKGKLERARSENSKKSHRKKITKLEDAITKWKLHLTDDATLKAYYLGVWRTFHGSDHLPLWVNLRVDFSDEYLDGLAGN